MPDGGVFEGRFCRGSQFALAVLRRPRLTTSFPRMRAAMIRSTTCRVYANHATALRLSEKCMGEGGVEFLGHSLVDRMGSFLYPVAGFGSKFFGVLEVTIRKRSGAGHRKPSTATTGSAQRFSNAPKDKQSRRHTLRRGIDGIISKRRSSLLLSAAITVSPSNSRKPSSSYRC